MPEKLLSGNACVSCAIFARASGSIAGPPRPPDRPSTQVWLREHDELNDTYTFSVPIVER